MNSVRSVGYEDFPPDDPARHARLHQRGHPRARVGAQVVKKGLEDNDYHAVEQDNFPPDYRDLVDKLRERIDSCDAVVHIAGHCYGAEPGERPPEAPRRSYTQLEYDIAVELKKPVYVFLTGDGFPADPHKPEPAELRELQQAHREPDVRPAGTTTPRPRSSSSTRKSAACG